MTTLLRSLNRAPSAASEASAPPVPRRQAVAGRVAVTRAGLAGDEIDASLGHGARALYAYPAEHYPFWDTVRAQLGAAAWDERLPFGALGEHLTLSGWLESDAWIGDLLRFPDCTLAVSEPRVPGAELSAGLGFAQAPQAMRSQAWCGFYLAVREPGTLAGGEAFVVVPGPREIGITELFRARRGG